MTRFNIAILLLVTIVAGCSSIKVVPEQVPAGIINLQENSQSVTRDKIAVTVAPAETDMVNYNIEGMVASFNVEIRNNGDSEVAFDSDSFILLDSNRRQYNSLTVEKIRQMMAKDTYYLLPYPYVGFYYLEDYELAAFKNSTNSNLPYYFELRPQELFTKALPTEPVIPGAGIKGLVYFHADIHALDSFSINVYRKGASKSAPPEFTFPFKVVK